MDMPAERFGRIHHLPEAQIEAVLEGMRDRGLVGTDGWLTEHGRAVHEQVEAVTDDLAGLAYESLTPSELAELERLLAPLAALLVTAQD
jgi:hypothetical protein